MKPEQLVFTDVFRFWNIICSKRLRNRFYPVLHDDPTWYRWLLQQWIRFVPGRITVQLVKEVFLYRDTLLVLYFFEVQMLMKLKGQ